MTKVSNAIIEEKNGFERILRIVPPFDRRNHPDGNFGIHGMEIIFVLKRNKRAVSFTIFTAIHLPHVWEDLKPKIAESLRQGIDVAIPENMGADVGYHSPEPMYPEQTVMDRECPYTDGICYYDGSGLRAQGWYDAWLEEGTDRIWEKMENEWKSLFGDFKLSKKKAKKKKKKQTFDNPMKGLEV